MAWACRTDRLCSLVQRQIDRIDQMQMLELRRQIEKSYLQEQEVLCRIVMKKTPVLLQSTETAATLHSLLS
jgi:hypothetical protein